MMLSVVSLTLTGLLCWGQPASVPSADGILAGGADPTIVAAAGGQEGYYVLSTGKGIPISYSTDLTDWTRIGRVFAENVPKWAQEDVPAGQRYLGTRPELA